MPSLYFFDEQGNKLCSFASLKNESRPTVVPYVEDYYLSVFIEYMKYTIAILWNVVLSGAMS